MYIVISYPVGEVAPIVKKKLSLLIKGALCKSYSTVTDGRRTTFGHIGWNYELYNSLIDGLDYEVVASARTGQTEGYSISLGSSTKLVISKTNMIDNITANYLAVGTMLASEVEFYTNSRLGLIDFFKESNKKCLSNIASKRSREKKLATSVPRR